MSDYFNKEFIILKTERVVTPTMDNLGLSFGVRTSNILESDRVQVETAELTIKEQREIRRDPRVRAIAPSMPMKLIKPVVESSFDDAGTGTSWGIEAVKALDCPYDDNGINIAVLDTGIDPEHTAFDGVEIVRKNYTTESDDDINGHGTHCAGTIFGRAVDGYRIGVATGVKKAIIGKVLGEGGNSSLQIAQAIQWALSEGAHVISMSLGMDFPGLVKRLVEQYGNDAIEAATSMALEAYRQNVNLFTQIARLVEAQGSFGEGAIIVAASGNESKRPDYEIAAAPPASGSGIVSVGALRIDNSKLLAARFSNNQVDIAAPGVDIISAALRGGLVKMSGTSMAAPHVAGVAALWAQRQRERTGYIESPTLLARLISSGSYGDMRPGFEEEDIGTGNVQAPQN